MGRNMPSIEIRMGNLLLILIIRFFASSQHGFTAATHCCNPVKKVLGMCEQRH